MSPNTTLRILLASILAFAGCIPCGPGGFIDFFQTREAVIGGNADRAILTWTESQAYSYGMCLPGFVMRPVRKEIAILDLDNLAVSPIPLSAQSAVATDGHLLAIQDYDASSVRIRDLDAGIDILELPIVSQRYAYDLPVAVSKPLVLLAYDPELPEQEGQPQAMLINAVTGDKQVLPHVVYASPQAAALSGSTLAYISDQRQIVVMDLGTQATTTVGTFSSTIPPQLYIVSQRVVWVDRDATGNLKQAFAFVMDSGSTQTLASWPAGSYTTLADAGEPGLLLAEWDGSDSFIYKLIGFDGASREVFRSAMSDSNFGLGPRFSGPYVLHPVAGGWEALDTRDNTTRTVDAFGYLE